VRYFRLLAALVVAGAACQSPTEPADPTFAFSVSRIFGVRRSPPEVEAGKGFVAIHGVFEVPHPLFTITGWLTQPNPRTLQLGVRGNPDGDGPLFASLHLYQSRIGALPKGRYDIQIIYVVNKGALRDSTLAYTTVVDVR
jgi:hypothetical protein